MVGGQELILLPICSLDEDVSFEESCIMAGAKYQMQPIVSSGSLIPIRRQLSNTTDRFLWFSQYHISHLGHHSFHSFQGSDGILQNFK